MATVTFTFPHNVVIAELDGPKIVFMPAKGENGEPGYTPVKGTDYWTDADVEEMTDAAIDAVRAALQAYLNYDTVGPADMAITDYGLDGFPMKSVTIAIVPNQSGSGDPSPENVRSISGWTSISVKRSATESGTGTTFSTSIPSTPGTVYNGTLEMVSGKLVIPSYPIKLYTFDGSSDTGWSRTGTAGTSTTFQFYDSSYYSSGYYCNYLKPVSSSATKTNMEYMWISSSRYLNISIHTSRLASDNVAGLMTYFQSNPLQIAVPRTPSGGGTSKTYWCDPVEITSLSGKNVLTSAAGQITAKIPIDLKAYVDDKLG